MSGQTPPADAASLPADRLPRREFAPPRRVPFRVKLKAGVHESVWEHGRETLEKELCGVLLGRLYRDDTGPFLLVEDWVRGEHARSDGAQVTFTHETWDYIHEQIRTRHPKEPPDIVGWYHTHPGFGIFLSEMDLFIHSNFFSAAHQVALVLDPRSGAEGTFGWVEGKVERLPTHWVGEREIGGAGAPSTASAPAGSAAAAASAPPARPRDADELDMVGWAGRIRSGTVLALLWGLLLGWVASQATFNFQVRHLVQAAAEGEVQGLVRGALLSGAQERELRDVAAKARALADSLPEPGKKAAAALAEDAERAARAAADGNRAVDRALAAQRTVSTTGELAIRVDRQGAQLARLHALVRIFALQSAWRNVEEALASKRKTAEQAEASFQTIRKAAAEMVLADPDLEPHVREVLPGALPARTVAPEGGR